VARVRISCLLATFLRNLVRFIFQVGRTYDKVLVKFLSKSI